MNKNTQCALNRRKKGEATPIVVLSCESTSFTVT